MLEIHLDAHRHRQRVRVVDADVVAAARQRRRIAQAQVDAIPRRRDQAEHVVIVLVRKICPPDIHLDHTGVRRDAHLEIRDRRGDIHHGVEKASRQNRLHDAHAIGQIFLARLKLDQEPVHLAGVARRAVHHRQAPCAQPFLTDKVAKRPRRIRASALRDFARIAVVIDELVGQQTVEGSVGIEHGDLAAIEIQRAEQIAAVGVRDVIGDNDILDDDLFRGEREHERRLRFGRSAIRDFHTEGITFHVHIPVRIRAAEGRTTGHGEEAEVRRLLVLALHTSVKDLAAGQSTSAAWYSIAKTKYDRLCAATFERFP